MREFRARDGRAWTARMEDGAPAGGELLTRVGWELVIFEPSVSHSEQRFVHRPAGWLGTATHDELLAALDEAESIRARWDMAQA